MEYNRKDKNNDTLLIKITTGTRSWNNDRVYCKIYQVINRSLLLFEYKDNIEVYSTHKEISYVMNWTCEEYELWANNCLAYYNTLLSNREQSAIAKDKINNGCNK